MLMDGDMISNLFAALMEVMYIIAPCYFGAEALFYFIFRLYMVPRANKLVPPPPFRDYGTDRSKLLVRVMRRIEATCAMNNRDVPESIHKFIAEWFQISKNKHHRPGAAIRNRIPKMLRSPSNSPENSDDECTSQRSTQEPLHEEVASPDQEPSVCLYQEDVHEFFSWAFFGKKQTMLVPWEISELDKICTLVTGEYNLVFPRKPTSPKRLKTQNYHTSKPRCMTLEPMNAMHRPLIIYFFVAVLTFWGGCLLRQWAINDWFHRKV